MKVLPEKQTRAQNSDGQYEPCKSGGKGPKRGHLKSNLAYFSLALSEHLYRLYSLEDDHSFSSPTT